MSKIKVGVLGATGMVGQRIVRLLHEHPWFEVGAMSSSERSAGKRYGDALRPSPAGSGPLSADVENMVLTESVIEAFGECKVIFSALHAEAAQEIEPKLAAAGFAVVSNASAFRMGVDVPLIVPEVNPEHIGIIAQQQANRGWSGYIVTNPNCSTIGLSLALAPVYWAFGIEKASIVTLQAISGAGYGGVSGLDIIDNVVPYIGNEEDKVETEPLKLLSKWTGSELEPPSGMKISAQCTRVPTTDGHMEMVSMELGKKASLQDVLDCWTEWKALPQELGLPSAPAHPVVVRSEANRPQPKFDRDTENGMATVVGRLRPCPLFDYKFAMLSHNLVRGAAGGVVLIAELLKAKGMLD
ncbi:MAG: aspartate-semialdehyde dehydrogenase [Chloroflexia bacterium]